MGPRPGIALLGIVLAASGCGSDTAVLEARSLVVSPCRDGEDGVFEPFRLEADLVRWFELDDVGFVEMRKGFRAATISDSIVLQVSDTAGLEETLADDPETRFELEEGMVRLSLVLNETCPDATQALVGARGFVTFDSFEHFVGGRIAGSGTFEIHDMRSLDRNQGTAPLAAEAVLDFDMKVRSGPPYEEFTD